MTQAGDLFFKVQNLDPHGWVNLTVPYTWAHSPYFTMHLRFPICTTTPATNTMPASEACTSGCTFDGGPLCPIISVGPGQTSDWVEVGDLFDSFNHGTMNLAPGQYTLHVGTPSPAATTSYHSPSSIHYSSAASTASTAGAADAGAADAWPRTPDPSSARVKTHTAFPIFNPHFLFHGGS